MENNIGGKIVPLQYFLVDFDNHEKKLVEHSSSSAISRASRRDGSATTSSQKNGQRVGDYWRIYFFMQYLQCTCPFRFVRVSGSENPDQDEETPVYTVKSWRPQNVLCFIINAASVFGILGELRLALPSDTSNPKLYFQMAQTVAFSIGKYQIITRYWLDQDRYLRLLNMVMSTELGTLKGNVSLVRRFISSKYSFFAICIIYWVNEVGYYVLGLDAGTADKSTQKTSMWRDMMIDAKFNFLFQSKENQTFNENGPENVGDYVLQILACLNYYQRIIMGAFDNMYSLGSILTLWSMTASFIQELEDEHGFGKDYLDPVEPHVMTVAPVEEDELEYGPYMKPHPWWPRFFHRYQTLKFAAEEISAWYGHNVTFVIIETIVFFATALQGMFVQLNANKGYLRSVVAIVVIFVICSCCVLSADLYEKMWKVRVWLFRPEIQFGVPRDELEYVLDDLYNNGLAIRASNRFPVTYETLAAIAGSVVTFFLVCVQI